MNDDKLPPGGDEQQEPNENGNNPGKNKGGRPPTTVLQRLSKIVFDYDRIYKLALRGFTDMEFAELLGIDVGTFHRWKNEDEEFLQLLKRGKEVADNVVEASLFQNAIGYSHKATKFFMYEGAVISQEYIEQYQPNVTAQIFWLKNRKPHEWRDKVEMNHSGIVEGRVTHIVEIVEKD